MRVRMACFVMLLTCLATPAAQAETRLPTLDARRIEQVMADLGLPVGKVDDVWDHDTGRATCAWRELTGRTPSTLWPTVPERRPLKNTKVLIVPKYMRVGLNINYTCQTAVWVQMEPTQFEKVVTDPVTLETTTVITIRLAKAVHRVMPVSTGMSSFPTALGVHEVSWTVNRWWQSTIYPDGKMYRPMFFHKGMALHGSSSDDLVKWYPASHGCVRMLHADIDALWDEAFGRGDTVYIYGAWQN